MFTTICILILIDNAFVLNILLFTNKSEGQFTVSFFFSETLVTMHSAVYFNNPQYYSHYFLFSGNLKSRPVCLHVAILLCGGLCLARGKNVTKIL